ncbi:family 43 glycosylhydrolase [Saccharicrinis sp. FJH54]|uniref:family 43 glycosylhydrolase n=1 Tax=Saccharicrinis sp. FJH54 TaxID=3344665 RepID=UPI0035D4B746
MAKTCKHIFKLVLLTVILLSSVNILSAQTLKLHYNPATEALNATTISDASGNGFSADLVNGASIVSFDNMQVIELGSGNGYVNMGTGLGNLVTTLQDFTVFCKLYIPSSTSITSNGNFVWTIANSNNIATDANGCLFFSAKNGRYAITPNRWTGEEGIQTGSALQKGAWITVTYVQQNGTGSLYYNGLLTVSGEIAMTPSELGKTSYNYLGRSCYAADSYLRNAKYADFRIYDGALSSVQIEALSGLKTSSDAVELLAEFDFSSASDSEDTYTGSLHNGAQLTTFGAVPVLDLGDQNGYFDFSAAFGDVIATLDSFSVSTNIYIPESTSVTGNGNFIWTFANSDNMGTDANGNMFLTAISTRYAISNTGYWSEEELDAGVPMMKGKWVNLTYTQLNGHSYIYLDADLIANGTISKLPGSLGSTGYNYLGRSCYAGDGYLKNAVYSNFRIYKGAINRTEIESISAETAVLNHTLDSMIVTAALSSVTIENKDEIRSKIALPGSVSNDISISWSSSDESVVTSDGTVYRPSFGSDPISVTMTATLTRNAYSASTPVEITVLPQYSDEESVDIDLSGLEIGGNTTNARSSVILPYKTAEGSKVSWSTDAPDFINTSGRVLKPSPLGQGKKQVTMTATVTKGDVTKTKDFTIYIAEKEDRSAYLFTYFTGNAQSQEQIHFALSNDGFNYTALNNGNPVINSADIALKKAVRDPHILRCEDGKTFYMVVTDMKSSEGWSSNRGIVLLKSTDLVNWTSATVNFPTRWPDQWANVLRVWAPQTVYDPDAGKYMVYFSLLTSDGKVTYDKIFYCYANADFTDLEGEPQYLFDRGSATIDGDIIFSDVDKLYHMFFKNEGIGGISEVTAETLTPQDGETPGSQWSTPLDNVDQTDEAVEGAGVFRLIDQDKWILMYDCYGAGHYQFCETPDLKNFSYVMDNYSMDARHGTSIAISEAEVNRLIEAFPSTALNSISGIGARNKNIRDAGIDINSTSKNIHIPVYYGVDLSSFDPELYATPGTTITPVGNQDFTNGSVAYTFTLNGNSVTYNVTTEIWANPVIPDFHADPEVLYSEQTGLFYIYPTTDGYPGWGGYYFDVYSSPDLVNWTNQGTFLDLSTDQVSWATGNAWAPCIIEKKIADNQYRYYFYFSGESGGKKTGVAVSDYPTGPFVDSGSPMISSNPDGVGGQIIDSDVFEDPVSGKTYIYWGNGYMAVAELNDDMTSVKEETIKVITPQGGTLATYAFREGTYVFYRDGLYYFLWSVDDTGSPNYHVAYGTSDSPTGPINVASQPIVIKQDPDNEIYGTAHNSIIQIPGRDEWYIVYHRINKNYLNDGPGYHREVCIDRLYFNEDGTIKPVTPTHRGINPVDVSSNFNTSTSQFFFNRESAKGAVIQQELYTVSGQLISVNDLQAQNGIIIVVNHYENGSTDTKKMVVLNH